MKYNTPEEREQAAKAAYERSKNKAWEKRHHPQPNVQEWFRNTEIGISLAHEREKTS